MLSSDSQCRMNIRRVRPSERTDDTYLDTRSMQLARIFASDPLWSIHPASLFI